MLGQAQISGRDVRPLVTEETLGSSPAGGSRQESLLSILGVEGDSLTRDSVLGPFEGLSTNSPTGVLTGFRKYH